MFFAFQQTFPSQISLTRSVTMKHVAATLSLWIFRWIEISLRGWGSVVVRLVGFFLELFRATPPSMHLFVIASLCVSALSAMPWFSYTLNLGGAETYELTTNLWYLFLIPGALGLLFALIVRPWSFRIQLTVDGAAGMLFFFGWIFPSFHSDMKQPPDPTTFFFLYPAALLGQMVLSLTLRHADHGILNRMRNRWKLKAAP